MSESIAPRRLQRAEAVLATRRRGFTVVLEDAHDRHNVSAVLRTCEAFGIQDVHLVIEQNEAPAINVDVTQSAHLWLTVHRHYGTQNAILALRNAGYAIYVGHVQAGATPLPRLPHAQRAAYVFGNEHSGVTQTWLANADAIFTIPTSGFMGSLNLSVAAALVIYDRLFGRPDAEPPPGDLTDAEKTTLRAQWYEALAHGSDALAARFKDFLDAPPPPRAFLPADTHQRRRAARLAAADPQSQPKRTHDT